MPPVVDSPVTSSIDLWNWNLEAGRADGTCELVDGVVGSRTVELSVVRP